MNQELRDLINVEEVLEWIDVDLHKLIAHLPAKERLTGLKPEERLIGLKPEERLIGLKPEEIQQLLQQTEHSLDKQSETSPIDPVVNEKRQTLLKVLHHRFGELPVSLTQQIEGCTKRKILTNWLDLALDAPSLEAFSIALHPTGKPTSETENV